MTVQRTFARSLVTVRTWPFFIDVSIGLCALAVFMAIVHTAAYWLGTAVPTSPISESARSLPLYALYSVTRIAIAYVLSLIFAVGYGYIAAHNTRVEAWMIAVLDILQSIPVLSFLPPVLLAMIALVPHHQLGIEMGVILLIFTGQVWNLAFSFYSSVKAIPREMIEASRIYRYSAWQRFWQLEMPYAAIGLVWNSIVSVANGWFALMACEMFPLNGTNFQLPGLGSYIQTATYSGDVRALVSGIAAIVLIVVATDQLIWRPLIAWSEKFKFEQVEAADHVTSPILTLLQRSALVNALSSRFWDSIQEPVYRRLARTRECKVVQPIDPEPDRRGASLGYWIAGVAFALVVSWGVVQCAAMLRQVTLADLRMLLRGRCRHFSARECRAAYLRALDRSSGRRHRLQSQGCAHRSAGCTGAGIRSGDCILSHSADWIAQDWRRPRNRLRRTDAAGYAMVHPVQRDSRGNVHSLGPARRLLRFTSSPAGSAGLR